MSNPIKRLTDTEVAEVLQVNVRTIRRLVRRTPQEAVRPWVAVGRLRRWSPDIAVLEMWLRGLEAAAA